MMTLVQIAASLSAVGIIGGGALTLDRLHVASDDFEQYIEQRQESDERDYVRDLKKDIREIIAALAAHGAGDDFLQYELADLIDELCEYRPNDKLCD